MKPELYDISLASTTLLELYKSKGLTDLQSALLLANENIKAKILSIGDETWTKSKLNAIKKLIDEEIAASYGGLYESMKDESVSIATITKQGVLGAVATATLDTATVADLISSTRDIQGYGFKDLFKLTQDNHARQLKVTLASGVAQGLSPSQIIKQYDIKSNQLTKGQVASNVFTVITDSKNQGNYNAYKDLEKLDVIKFYEHVSVLDSNTSEICRKSDSRKYYQKIEEIKSSQKPPLHFNCRSQLIGRTKEKDGTTLRASQFGAVPANENYTQWFNKQSPTFQKSVLKGKYSAFKDGRYKVSTLADVKGSLSLDEYKEGLFAYVNGELPK